MLCDVATMTGPGVYHCPPTSTMPCNMAMTMTPGTHNHPPCLPISPMPCNMVQQQQHLVLATANLTHGHNNDNALRSPPPILPTHIDCAV